MPKLLIFNPPSSGGSSIGSSISGATEGSVLFAGAGGILAQDNANFFYNTTTDRLELTQNLEIKTTFLGVDNTAGWMGISALYGILLSPKSPDGVYINVGNGSEISSGTLLLVRNWFNTVFSMDYNGSITSTARVSTAIPYTIKLAAAQTANAFEIQPNGSTTPIFHVNSDGNIFVNNGQLTATSTGGGWSSITAPIGSQLRMSASVAVYIGAGVDALSGIQVDTSATATHTRFFLYDVDKGALSRVLVGAADSGGSGFKMLRVVN